MDILGLQRLRLRLDHLERKFDDEMFEARNVIDLRNAASERQSDGSDVRMELKQFAIGIRGFADAVFEAHALLLPNSLGLELCILRVKSLCKRFDTHTETLKYLLETSHSSQKTSVKNNAAFRFADNARRHVSDLLAEAELLTAPRQRPAPVPDYEAIGSWIRRSGLENQTKAWQAFRLASGFEGVVRKQFEHCWRTEKNNRNRGRPKKIPGQSGNDKTSH